MKNKPVMILTLLWLSGLSLVTAHDITIESHEVPLVIDTYGRYQQNQSLFDWTPFDSTIQVWDLTRYPTPLRVRAGLRHYSEGSSPAPDSMENDPPAPDVCEFDTVGNYLEGETYLYLNGYGLFIDGLSMTQQGVHLISNYRPDGVVYNFPMYLGGSWMSAWFWQYEVVPGIPYRATEQHQKRIVARGKVKIPMSGEYFWPCLVIKDYMVYNDNVGTNERRWIYEWVVPGHFCGGSGVAAAISQSGAAPDFTTVESFLQLDTLIVPGWDLLPPRFGATTILTDTAYPGPFVVSSTITDNDAVGAESLFYRVNQGAWVSVPADSHQGNIYYFTIPGVTPPARLDYYIWAMDEFSADNEIEFWTTFPFCSPESTMITFNVTTTGFEEFHPVLPAETRLIITPNPFTTSTVFQLQHPFAKTATLQLYRADGTHLQKLMLNQQSKGLLTTTWHRGRLPAGVYFYQCTAPGFSETGKITISK